MKRLTSDVALCSRSDCYKAYCCARQIEYKLRPLGSRRVMGNFAPDECDDCIYVPDWRNIKC
jgi:hypothetical protein